MCEKEWLTELDFLLHCTMSKPLGFWFINGLGAFDNRIVLKSKDYGKWFQAKYNLLTAEYFEDEENVEINIIMKKIKYQLTFQTLPLRL